MVVETIDVLPRGCRIGRLNFTLYLLFLAISWNGWLPQQTEVHTHTHTGDLPPAGASSVEGVRVSVPDVWVVDQDGRRLRFYSDLVRGRTVAINFIFTTCTTVCPLLGTVFAQVQRHIDELMIAGRVRLISVSVDPVYDTPERLKAWGSRFRARPGWALVTGEKTEIDRLLKALGAYANPKETHTPVVLVGNETRGRWVRAVSPPADRLADLIRDMAGLPSARP